ncbi:hypothetical protein [Nesterenkonia pannonica]|uniref:hypothetical protein n=1 Tax=Nesterenkonia pannonica TaxID=1548602 RepID=UPI00216433B4|nr:hypothetical protein [Nesterenkonia pannonica]
MISPAKAGFVPVILGPLIHGYTAARSFHEIYGVKSVMLARNKTGYTWASSILDLRLHEDLNDDEAFLRILTETAAELRAAYGVPLVLVPSNDVYVELVARHAEELGSQYLFNSPHEELRAQLMDKEAFYALAGQHGLDIPATQIHRVGSPSSSRSTVSPWSSSPRTPTSGGSTTPRSGASEGLPSGHAGRGPGRRGCRGGLALPRVADHPGVRPRRRHAELGRGAVSQQRGEVRAGDAGPGGAAGARCQRCGHLQRDHLKYDEALMTRFSTFLEEIGYTGIANADMKWDERDGVYKVMEINCRPGRSSYYTSQLGHPLVQHLVDDVVHGRRRELTLAQGDVLFRVTPRYVLRDYVKDPEVLKEVKRLFRERKDLNPLHYAKDLSPKRNAYLLGRHLKQGRKYAA